MSKQPIAAVAYLRVSSKGQIGGHGFDRQREAIAHFAKVNGYRVQREYADAHTGTDADRPAFAEMLGDLLANGCRTVIVESMDRFARDLAVQIALVGRLHTEGIALISAATGEDVTAAASEDPMREALVLVQGVFAQVEKKRLVAKLRKSRAAMRARVGRCEGRKPFGARPGEADSLELMRQLRRKPRGGERPTYADIARALNERGCATRTGKPWSREVVRQILVRAN